LSAPSHLVCFLFYTDASSLVSRVKINNLIHLSKLTQIHWPVSSIQAVEMERCWSS